MPQLSDFLGVKNSIGLTSGGPINTGDAIELGPDGLAYSAQTTDYAIVPNKGSVTIAQATIFAQFLSSPQRAQSVQASNGDLIFAVPASTTPDGLQLYRYSPSGVFIAQMVLEAAGGTSVGLIKLINLSNGNIAATYVTNGSLKFSIVDASLNIVKSSTSVETINGSGIFDAVALTAGGFNLSYEQATTTNIQRIATYSNTGAVVLAPTTLVDVLQQNGNAGAGSAAATYARLRQLVTSGNIVLALATTITGTSAAYGLGYIIYNPTTGSVVKTFTVIELAGGSNPAELSNFAGFFAIAYPNGSQLLVKIYNEAGTQQGATYAKSTTANSAPASKLVNDGVNFYHIFDDTTISRKSIVRVPTTGGATALLIAFGNTPAINGQTIDAFCERGYIVMTTQGNGGSPSQPTYATVTTAPFSVKSAPTVFGTAPATTNGQYCSLMPSGDFSFIFTTDQAVNSATIFTGLKYADTALIGVAGNTVAAAALAVSNVVAGAYQTNQMKGSVSKAFDHTIGANTPGNKGVIFPNGIVLKGF